MVLTAANVKVGVTGAVFAAPAGTAVPSSVSGSLDGAFEDVGYISEEGVSTSTSIDVNDIKAWQNGDTVRKIQTGHDFTLTFAMLETNPTALEVYYGDYATGAVQVTGTQGYRGAFVINVVDGDDLIRIVIPDGQVTDKQDVNYVNADPITYGVTITTYPDTSGVKAYIYFDSAGTS